MCSIESLGLSLLQFRGSSSNVPGAMLPCPEERKARRVPGVVSYNVWIAIRHLDKVISHEYISNILL